MLRQVTAKKIVGGKIVGFWSQRHDDKEVQFATLQQIYEFAVKNHDDVKTGKMDATEPSQYGIMLDEGVMVISISKKDRKYEINHVDGDNMKNALDGLTVKD